MPRYRIPKKGKFWIPRHKYRLAVAYCQTYPEWRQELEDLTILHSPAMDGMPHSTDVSDSTARNAMRVMRIQDKIQLIEDIVKECCSDSLYPYMLLAVTREGLTWAELQEGGIPTSRTAFFMMKRQILYEVSRRM